MKRMQLTSRSSSTHPTRPNPLGLALALSLATMATSLPLLSAQAGEPGKEIALKNKAECTSLYSTFQTRLRDSMNRYAGMTFQKEHEEYQKAMANIIDVFDHVDQVTDGKFYPSLLRAAAKNVLKEDATRVSGQAFYDVMNAFPESGDLKALAQDEKQRVIALDLIQVLHEARSISAKKEWSDKELYAWHKLLDDYAEWTRKNRPNMTKSVEKEITKEKNRKKLTSVIHSPVGCSLLGGGFIVGALATMGPEVAAVSQSVSQVPMLLEGIGSLFAGCALFNVGRANLSSRTLRNGRDELKHEWFAPEFLDQRILPELKHHLAQTRERLAQTTLHLDHQDHSLNQEMVRSLNSNFKEKLGQRILLQQGKDASNIQIMEEQRLMAKNFRELLESSVSWSPADWEGYFRNTNLPLFKGVEATTPPAELRESLGQLVTALEAQPLQQWKLADHTLTSASQTARSLTRVNEMLDLEALDKLDATNELVHALQRGIPEHFGSQLEAQVIPMTAQLTNVSQKILNLSDSIQKYIQVHVPAAGKKIKPKVLTLEDANEMRNKVSQFQSLAFMLLDDIKRFEDEIAALSGAYGRFSSALEDEAALSQALHGNPNYATSAALKELKFPLQQRKQELLVSHQSLTFIRASVDKYLSLLRSQLSHLNSFSSAVSQMQIGTNIDKAGVLSETAKAVTNTGQEIEKLTQSLSSKKVQL